MFGNVRYLERSTDNKNKSISGKMSDWRRGSPAFDLKT